MADLSIAIEILGVDKASGAFGAVAKGAGGLLGGLRDLGLGALGIGTAFDTVKGAVEGMLGPAIEAQQVATQTASVLKATGEAAGLSATDISEYAGAMSKLVPFEDEAIQSSENLLLTFTNIKGPVFQDAENAILDMSQALGQDLKSSSIQVGKALNDPVKGISALSRVGVSFTQEQKDMIGTMVEAGDVAGAQGIILAELSHEFGGAAEAAGKTFGGQLVILQTAMGNVAEAIGGPIIGGLASLATAVLPAVQAFADDLPGAIDGFMESLSGLGDQLAPTIQFLTDAWETVIEVFSGDWSASDSIDPVVNVIGQLATIVRDDVLPTLELLGGVVTDVFSGDFASAFEGMQQILSEALPFLVADLAAMGEAFLSWVGPLIPPLLQQLVGLSLQIGTWINTVALPMLIEQLATWAAAFIDWVVPLIPPLMRELGGLLLQLTNYLVNVALPSLLTNLGKWGLAFVEWVGPRIPLLIGELAKLQLELLGWVITTALPAIITKLGEWGAAFVGWVAKDAIPKLVPALALIGQGIIDWAGQVLPSLVESAAGIGRALVDDIRNGISGALDGLQRWVTDNLANALPQWVRDVLGIHSPSSVFADIGSDIIRGLEQGITRQWPSVDELVQRLMGQFAALGRNVGGDVDDWLRAALAITGTDMGWLGGLRQLVAAESGGDPGAVNPTAVSTGEHATGLLQTIPSTFNAYKLEGFGNIFNPIDNAIAAIRYIKSRYGSVYNTPFFDQGPEGYLGYAAGGVVPGPAGAGQWAYVHGGEFNLTPEQFNTLAGGGGDTYVFNFPNYLGSRAELVDQIESGLAVKKQNNGRLAFA